MTTATRLAAVSALENARPARSGTPSVAKKPSVMSPRSATTGSLSDAFAVTGTRAPAARVGTDVEAEAETTPGMRASVSRIWRVGTP